MLDGFADISIFSFRGDTIVGPKHLSPSLSRPREVRGAADGAVVRDDDISALRNRIRFRFDDARVCY